MPSTNNQYFSNLLYTNEYSFCPKCGVDITIYSHEEDCPCIQQHHTEAAPLAIAVMTPAAAPIPITQEMIHAL
jgi:hypothetical protein